MIKNRNIFKLYIIILLCVSHLHLNGQNTFIENKGQFPEKVKAKVNLPSGSLFIEEGRLNYVFYSQKQLTSIHDLSAVTKKINAHSYIVEFVNHNTEVSTKLLEPSKYYENYFLGSEDKWALDVKSYKSLFQKNIYNGIDIFIIKKLLENKFTFGFTQIKQAVSKEDKELLKLLVSYF